ncbi:hypothetical protein QBE52_17725 [Clostridiaceae bacterium 35-E11]
MTLDMIYGTLSTVLKNSQYVFEKLESHVMIEDDHIRKKVLTMKLKYDILYFVTYERNKTAKKYLTKKEVLCKIIRVS